MKKSGLADSPFFSDPTKQPLPTSSSGELVQTQKTSDDLPNHDEQQPAKPSNERDTTIPRYHDTLILQPQDTTASPYPETIIELIRKAVKELGKEAATHRFTEEEKQAIADIIYDYKRLKITTTENEIARIGINFIINDYKENGHGSILARVIEALLA